MVRFDKNQQKFQEQKWSLKMKVTERIEIIVFMVTKYI